MMISSILRQGMTRMKVTCQEAMDIWRSRDKELWIVKGHVIRYNGYWRP